MITISLLSPLGKGRGSSFKQTWISFTHRCFASFDWNWLSGSKEEDVLMSINYFRHFSIIYPWKRTWPFNWCHLKSHHPRMFCAKFVWNMSGGLKKTNIRRVDDAYDNDNFWSCELKTILVYIYSINFYAHDLNFEFLHNHVFRFRNLDKIDITNISLLEY